jgi:hypothetical protein
MGTLQNGNVTANRKGPILDEDRVANSPAEPGLENPRNHDRRKVIGRAARRQPSPPANMA